MKMVSIYIQYITPPRSSLHSDFFESGFKCVGYTKIYLNSRKCGMRLIRIGILIVFV
jgi:hypothetical protein